MTRSEMVALTCPPVNCRRGAPMGRRSDAESDRPTDRRIYDWKVPMVDGDYDPGGAYWGGGGTPLRVEFTADGECIRFYRAWVGPAYLARLNAALRRYNCPEVTMAEAEADWVTAMK